MDTLRQHNWLHPKWIIPGMLAIALLSLLVVSACITVSKDLELKRPSAPVVGRRAPDFTLTDLNGNQVKLSSLQGKTVFLNFWATWCPACRIEMPEIEAIYQKYKNKDVVIIGVDLFEPENLVRQFVQEGGYSWTFVIDTTGEVTNNYQVTAIPASFFLDKKGVIRAINIGAMTKEKIETKLAETMK